MAEDKAKEKLDKSMTFKEVLSKCPEAGSLMVEKHMHCIHCAMAASETVEQGCKAHGLSDEEIDALMEEINKKYLA